MTTGLTGRQAALPHQGTKVVGYPGAAPALSIWKTDVLAVTPIPHWKMAAGAGIAPASAAFQTAAHLSEPSSEGKGFKIYDLDPAPAGKPILNPQSQILNRTGPSAWYRATVCRLSAGGSAFELQKG